MRYERQSEAQQGPSNGLKKKVVALRVATLGLKWVNESSLRRSLVSGT